MPTEVPTELDLTQWKPAAKSSATGMFDDLIGEEEAPAAPAKSSAAGMFDDLIQAAPATKKSSAAGMFDDLISPEGGLTDRAWNAIKSYPKALVEGTGETIAGGARLADIAKSGDILNIVPEGSAKPTIRQERRAFEAAMKDPRYAQRLTEMRDDPSGLRRVESLYGPEAQLGVARARIEGSHETAAQLSKARQARMEESPTYQYGRAVSEVAQEVYPTRPDLDEKWESQIMAALGGTTPTIALGLVPGVGQTLASVQYGAQAGEQAAQEAIAAGKPEAADIAYLANAGLGGVSEYALGVAPRLLKIVKTSRLKGLAPGKLGVVLEEWAKSNPVKAKALIGVLREAPQEGLEQLGANVIASDIAEYDPERPAMKGVLGATALGGVTGGIVTGGATKLHRMANRETIEFQEKLDQIIANSKSAAELDAAAAELTAATKEAEVEVGVPAATEEAAPETTPTVPTVEEAPGEVIAPTTAAAAAAPAPAVPAAPAAPLALPEVLAAASAPTAAPAAPAVTTPAAPAAPEAATTPAAAAPTTPSAEVELAEAKARWVAATKSLVAPKLGIVPQGGQDMFEFYLATRDLAGIYVRRGIKSAAEFAKAAGIKLDQLVQEAWDDAMTGRKKATIKDLHPDSVAAITATAAAATAPAPAPTTPGATAPAAPGIPQSRIVADTKREGAAIFKIYQKMRKLAAVHVKRGVKTAQEFAEKSGLPLTGVTEEAFNDAAIGDEKTSVDDMDPQVVLDAIMNLKERKFSTRFDKDLRIDPRIRVSTGNRNYAEIANALTVADAERIVEEKGIEGAQSLLYNENNGMDPRVRVALAQMIIQKANRMYAKTKADEALTQAVEVAEWMTEYGTKLGQGVQAFAIWAHLTPDGYVRLYKRAVNNSRKAKRGLTPPHKLPEYSEKIAKEVLKMAHAALQQPEGFAREEAILDVMAFIAKQKGISKWDAAIAIWYGSILSGYTTQQLNIFSTLMNIFLEFGTHSVMSPRAMPSMAIGLYQGMIKGAFDAANVLKTGKQTGTRQRKLEVPRVLEMIKYKGIAYPLNAWKYVFRVMSAADMVNFRMAEEMKTRWLAREVAYKEKLKGNALTARLAELMHNTKEMKAAALAQAKAEGFTGINLRRRTAEIQQQARPKDLVMGAQAFALKATYNHPPQGAIGAIANGMQVIARDFAPFRLVVPFTNVVANVLNTSLDYTPYGYLRLFPSFWGQNEKARPAPDKASGDYKLQAARATLGTIAMFAVYALAQAYIDDEDPWFTITARGPDDPAQQNQLRATGWKPHSIKIGNRYYNYLVSPLGVGFSIVGNMVDAQRYKKMSDQDMMTRGLNAVKGAGQAIMSQSFLVGLADFFDALSTRGGQGEWRGLGRVATSLIPNLVKQVDRLFDPTVYDAPTAAAAAVREIPVARGELRPKLNVLGEVIEYDLSKFTSERKGDPVWDMIVRKQAWVSTPSKTMMVGDRAITPSEYYNFVHRSGRAIKQRLAQEVPMIQRMRAEDAQDRVDKVVREERAKVKAQMFRR